MVNSPPNVTYLPFSNRETLAKVMAETCLFVFPTQVETFGLAVAEAMASGCAVVSSSKLPFSGIYLKDTSADAITAAITELIRDPERCRRLGADNVEKAQRYNWHRHGIAMDDLYRSLTGAL